MAKLKILVEPNELLRKRSKEVTAFGDRLWQLLDDMRETMAAAKHCMGLSAVQVGVLFRACILETSEGIVELINPRIVEARDFKCGQEGCVSLPNLYLNIKRANIVVVEYSDRSGKPQKREFRGIEAVCVAHEIDHMDGILFVNRKNSVQ